MNSAVGSTFTAATDCILSINAYPASSSEYMLVYLNKKDTTTYDGTSIYAEKGAKGSANIALKKNESLIVSYLTNCSSIILTINDLI